MADLQVAEVHQPGKAALHPPAMPAEPLWGLNAAPGDPRADAPAAQHLPAPCEVVAFVGVQLGWAPAWPAWPPPRSQHRWDRIDQLLQQPRIVGIGRRQAHGQRDPTAVDQQMVLRARLAAIYWIGTRQLPPCLARTLTLSIAALDQSIWPSSPSQSNNGGAAAPRPQRLARPAAAASR